MFEGFEGEKMKVKMQKPSKKKNPRKGLRV
jgi:hypothetical protein